MDDRQRLEDMIRLRHDPLEGMDDQIAELKGYEIIAEQDMVNFTVKLLDIYNRAAARISYDLEAATGSADNYIAQIQNPPFEFRKRGKWVDSPEYRRYPHSVRDVENRKKSLQSDAGYKKGQVIKRFGEELNSENIKIETEDDTLRFHLDGKHHRFKFKDPTAGIEQLIPRGILPFKRNKGVENAGPIYLQSSGSVQNLAIIK